MSSSARAFRPLGLGILLIVTGAAALAAAFALTLDRFAILADPDAALACGLSLLVQCGANLTSDQGAALGFPNPLIGLLGQTAVIVVGAGIVAGSRFARWFSLLFTTGVAAAMDFVIWLIQQSIFVIGTPCPWCMVVWAATIPVFLAVILDAVRARVIPLPPGLRAGPAPRTPGSRSSRCSATSSSPSSPRCASTSSAPSDPPLSR